MEFLFKDLLSLIKNKLHGNVLLLSIYGIDRLLILSHSKEKFRPLNLQIIQNELTQVYKLIYNFVAVFFAFILCYIVMIILNAITHNDAKSTFPLYFFLNYYLIYWWTLLTNLLILSGNINIAISNDEYFPILGILTIIFFYFSLIDLYEDYFNNYYH